MDDFFIQWKFWLKIQWLDKINVIKHVKTILLSTEKGCRKIWGDIDQRPAFWPEAVPFVSPSCEGKCINTGFNEVRISCFRNLCTPVVYVLGVMKFDLKSQLQPLTYISRDHQWCRWRHTQASITDERSGWNTCFISKSPKTGKTALLYCYQRYMILNLYYIVYQLL